MRHFAGILLGIVFIPVFFGLNWLVNLADGRAGDDPRGWSLLLLLGAYALIGVVAAVLLASRSISPMALLLCGVGIAAIEVMLLLPKLANMQVNVPRLYNYPAITDGYVLVAIGTAMIFAGFFPSRWHRAKPKATPVEEEYDEGPVDGRELLPTREPREPARDPAYDASWGTGRNDYADEPEVPYAHGGFRADDAPTTQQLPVAEPGWHEEPTVPVSQAGSYDQQALGYGEYDEPETAQFEQPEPASYGAFDEPATAQFERPDPVSYGAFDDPATAQFERPADEDETSQPYSDQDTYQSR